jgi:indole-3-glycerol phosphate synthase
MAANDFLKQIVVKKREKIFFAKSQLPLDLLKEKITNANLVAQPFAKSINKTGQISLIAEIKRASPSRGIIRENFNLLEIASVYQQSGVAAISVLTEEEYFQGNLDHLRLVKESVSTPVLRKDFIIDTYQLYESKAFGADAILLIAALLSRENLTELLEIANSLGLDCLIEVHNEKELKKVLGIKDANLIGINNRDLHTLEVDFKVTEVLFPLIPKEKTVVVESGIKSYQDILFLKILGAKAVLIGEVLMQATDIKAKLEELMG